MTIRAVLFDIYGTLIDIETDERDWYAYLTLAKYLGYRGINLSADEVRWFYFEKVRQQLERSQEKYPEIDVRKIWYEILTEHENQGLYRLNLDRCTFLRDLVALHRALTQRRLRLYNSTLDILLNLKNSFQLGIVSDCQHDYAVPEMKILGIYGVFDALVISADYGFRKPDQRLFNECLARLGFPPEEAVFVGNDAYRDINGAKSVGMKAVLMMSKQGSKDTRFGEPDLKIDTISQLPDALKKLGS